MNCEKIKQKIGIREVLESFGLFPVKENSKTAFYFALDRHEIVPSLSVDFVKNRAFDFGNGKSYDVVSIVQQLKKCSVSEALKYLSTLDFLNQNDFQSPKIQSKQDYSILEVKEIRHPALVQYLKSRRVYDQKHLVKEIHYQLNRKRYFGIGFENDSGGFEIRSSYSKICLGKKDVTLIENENNNDNEIALFEGFFDYLTFRSLDQSNNPKCDFLILNSTAMLFKVEKKLAKYEKISLFLDNDTNGRRVKLKIVNRFDHVEDCSLIYSEYNDMNEWYCHK